MPRCCLKPLSPRLLKRKLSFEDIAHLSGVVGMGAPLAKIQAGPDRKLKPRQDRLDALKFDLLGSMTWSFPSLTM